MIPKSMDIRLMEVNLMKYQLYFAKSLSSNKIHCKLLSKFNNFELESLRII